MWSPQRYLDEGQRLGRSEVTLREAVKQIQRLQEGQPPLPPILSLGHLAQRTDIPHVDLRSFVSRKQSQSNYRGFKIRKRSGGVRRISVPEPKLKAVQQWIAANILNRVSPHKASYAFAPGCSIVKCANRHASARWLIKIDVADFFGSITEIQVYRVFRSLGYNALVSFELARICTMVPHVSAKHQLRSWQVRNQFKGIPEYTAGYLGRLPQGAPTSPMLANLAMREADVELSELAHKNGMTYTRYSDDITFSSAVDIDRQAAHQMIGAASGVLKAKGLFLNKGKTAIVHPGARRVVLGLLVDGSIPKLTRAFRDNLRQHLYYLEKYGIDNHLSARDFDSAGGLYRHLRGLIDYARMVDAPLAERYLKRLEGLPWSK